MLLDRKNSSSRRLSRRSAIRVVASLAAALLLLAVLASITIRPREQLARRLAERLANADDSEASLLLRQLAALDEVGMAALVDALASPRDTIAVAAHDVLRDEMDQWRLLSARDSSIKVDNLARLLASNASAWQRERGYLASDLASRILTWPIDHNAIDGGKLIANCQIVLRIAARKASPRNSLASERNVSGGAGTTQTARQPNELLALPTDSQMFPISSHPLPNEIVQPPSLPPQVVESSAGRPMSDAFAPSLVVASPQPLEPHNPQPLPEADGGARSNRAASISRLDDPQLIRPASADAPVRWETYEDVDVMNLLQCDDADLAAAAEAELHRRGFNREEMRLARQLTDPNPAVRRELAAQLPRNAGVDARRWLLWLCNDDDVLVRREAYSILATSRDPHILEQVRKLLQRETDPQLRKLLEKGP